ncbi:hypothetical protein N7517_011514 [Penicillium concentricum]|uniref:Xylanolytic transcriptional activator regulatory domain-containing protein n=1 Tax=Penicillium concentricum TaxID=293559 RepID=A0A9W9UVG6_9EURO|nr:uncharacterized protein N7517_011514 [Penicillium concentricum]KAJ5356905.1 hypothetical protein N7517_011514 [Penicillium concentricum]
MQNQGTGFGRNSHVPAVEAKPLTFAFRHLTAVENRLHLLESTLRRLFPTGEMDAITRTLLTDEVPTDQPPSASVGPINQVSVDDPLPPDPMTWDGVFPNDSSPRETETDLRMGAELRDQASPFNCLLTGSPHKPELVGTGDEENELLDNYFLHYHTLYPILHEGTFRLEYKGQIKASPHWQILASTVLAIGAWLTVPARHDLDKRYFAKAQNMVQRVSFAEKGDITLVQSLVLLGEFSKKQASPEESGHYIGTAVRMAVFLNLHIKPTSPYSSELDKEIRRRVWWSVYCAESCSAKIYGRPLLLPEEMLITVEPVSNIHESTLRSSATLFPVQTDHPTVYTGLIQQSSYHRMANKIYRRLLSTPSITPQNVHEVDSMIDAWHNGSSLCTQVIDHSSAPEWHLAACRRQILCDRSLRQLIHRPLLLKWLKNMSMNTGPPTEKHPNEIRCRANGLNMARTTIGIISESIVDGDYSPLTLSFTLYAFFHALIVPLIHLKADPSSPESISCIQDIKKAELALNHLSIERDDLSQYFIAVLRRLFLVASQTNSEESGQGILSDGKRMVNPHDVQSVPHGIFGNECLALLDNEALKSGTGLNFSEWVNS